MPPEEIGIWQSYIAKNGPLSMQRRNEAHFAHLALLQASVHRAQGQPAPKIRDFLIWSGQQQGEAEAEDALGELLGVARPKADAGQRRRWKRPQQPEQSS